ncbi:hypothetical protein [Nonomuraea sp. NPDC049141]|uniref:hypothetical protein n=1 Tax=Nonomuraea sp. NPDC049141 TaxID=3155500 RepID=UPI0033C4CB16
MSRESEMGGLLQQAPAKMNPAGLATYITLIFVLCAVPLLLANWFIVAAILGRDCVVSYAAGNITECGGGLSEEEMSAASGLIALVIFAIQTGLIALVRRRIQSRAK